MLPVTVKYPTRARPELFKQTFRAYRQDDAASFIVSLDADDPSMNCPAMLAWLDEQPRTTVRVGNSKSKIEAINDGLNGIPWDGVLIVASDDMIPQRPDYAKRIAELYDEFFPEGDGVLHLNDGYVGRKLNTLCILDKKYYQRFRYVYAPCYRALWCDNEFMEVSEQLGRAMYVNEVVIRHEWIGHYNRGDALLTRNEAFNEQDARTYEMRRRQGFPVESVP